MRKLFALAAAATVLAAGSRAMGQGLAGPIENHHLPHGLERQRRGHPGCQRGALAQHSAVAIGVLNSGVTESTIQTLFAAGNVQGILNDFNVLATTAIGVGDTYGPGTTAPPALATRSSACPAISMAWASAVTGRCP